jgi:hypothetical protein
MPASVASDSQVRRPGRGWKWLGSSVWEHRSGIRIHGLGRVRFADGSSRMWTCQEECHFRRRQGYNTKRALMVWALSLLSPKVKDEPRG